MKQISILLFLGLLFTSSCKKFDPNSDPVTTPNCEYDDQENISFINFGLKVPEYTGTFFDNVYGINYASSDRTIYFLTQVLETRGNYSSENVASAKVRFITDGEDCAGSETFSFHAGDSEVGGTNILAPAPSTPWSGDVQLTIRSDAFTGQYDSGAFTVTWVKRENNPDNIIEGNLTGQKLHYRSTDQSVLIPRPIYGGGEYLN